MTCALVPENPNELTPAIRGRPSRAQGRASSTTRTGSRSQGMCGDGFRKFRCFGNSSCSSDRMTLIRPAIPAAASRWPIFVFTDPISSGRLASRPSPSAAPAAWTSIGSPSDVPVPCASRYPTSPAATPAHSSASAMTRCWATPFGTVKPPDAPSWLTALPRITARIRSPSRIASSRRFTTTTPQPSPRT